jgi:hypothetical protein
VKISEGLPPLDTLVMLDYTNYRGVRDFYVVKVVRYWFGSTIWHPPEQQLMRAVVVDKDASRDFAVKDIHEWFLA